MYDAEETREITEAGWQPSTIEAAREKIEAAKARRAALEARRQGQKAAVSTGGVSWDWAK